MGSISALKGIENNEGERHNYLVSDTRQKNKGL